MFVRALAYILANGPDGLRQTTEDAVLNANYIRAKLEGTFELQFKSPSLHEVVFSDKLQAKNGVKTGDMGKRLIDYGFHAYTVSFPLVVSGAMMIEPTESESREELDLLIDALKQIAREAAENPEMVKTAPHTTRLRWRRGRQLRSGNAVTLPDSTRSAGKFWMRRLWFIQSLHLDSWRVPTRLA